MQTFHVSLCVFVINRILWLFRGHFFRVPAPKWPILLFLFFVVRRVSIYLYCWQCIFHNGDRLNYWFLVRYLSGILVWKTGPVKLIKILIFSNISYYILNLSLFLPQIHRVRKMALCKIQMSVYSSDLGKKSKNSWLT